MTFFLRAMIAMIAWELAFAKYRLARVSHEFFYGDLADVQNVISRRRRIQAEIEQLQADLAGWQSHLQLQQLNP